MASGEWRIGMTIEGPVDQFVSGPEGVAGRHDLGGVLLRVDGSISSRRTVRDNFPNQASRRINSCQYCGRARAREYRQLCAIAPGFAGLVKGTGDSSAVGAACRHSRRCRLGHDNGAMRELRQNGSRIDTISAGQIHEMTIRHSPFAIRPAAGAAP